ncbi:hypothetical protein MC885_010516, partial [Smutsia gigantea]
VAGIWGLWASGTPQHPPGPGSLNSTGHDELGMFDAVNQKPHTAQFPKYLSCYQCLLETKELGCLLESDICLVPPGSSCMTLLIKNSKLFSPVFGPFRSQMVTISLLSGSDMMVSGCRSKEQTGDCSHTCTSPAMGF